MTTLFTKLTTLLDQANLSIAEVAARTSRSSTAIRKIAFQQTIPSAALIENISEVLQEEGVPKKETEELKELWLKESVSKAHIRDVMEYIAEGPKNCLQILRYLHKEQQDPIQKHLLQEAINQLGLFDESTKTRNGVAG